MLASSRGGVGLAGRPRSAMPRSRCGLTRDARDADRARARGDDRPCRSRYSPRPRRQRRSSRRGSTAQFSAKGGSPRRRRIGGLVDQSELGSPRCAHRACPMARRCTARVRAIDRDRGVPCAPGRHCRKRARLGKQLVARKISASPVETTGSRRARDRMNVVVTGATGFIGSALVAQLRRARRLRRHRPYSAIPNARSTRPSRRDARARRCRSGRHMVPRSARRRRRGRSSRGAVDGGRRWDARYKQLIRDSRVEVDAADRRGDREAVCRPATTRADLRVGRRLLSVRGAAARRRRGDREGDRPSDSFLGRLCRRPGSARRARPKLMALASCACAPGSMLGPGGALAAMTSAVQVVRGRTRSAAASNGRS